MRPVLAREERAGPAFVTPALALIAGVALVPMLGAFWLSLHREMPVFRISRFVGLDNFAFLLRDPRFLKSLGNTAYLTFLGVAIETALGLGLALLLHRSFPGRGLARAALLVPWAVPTVVSGRLWEWILNPSYGILNHVLGTDLNWLGHPSLAIHAVLLADVWKTTPFAALLLLAGLQVVPRDLLQAARVDGAGAARTFFHVTLPFLRPALLVVLLFRTLDSFRIFDVVYVLTGGGPANTTETLSVYAYKLTFSTLDFGYGSAVAAVTFLCVLGLSLVYVRLLVGRRA